MKKQIQRLAYRNIASERKTAPRLLRSVIVSLILVPLILAIPKTVFAQQHLSTEVVDITPIEHYLEIAGYIRKNGRADDALVTKYFSNPTVALFKQRPGFDSLKFISNLTAVYSNKLIPEAEQGEDYKLMVKYRQNETIIRKGLELVKKTDIGKMVRKRLKPFYPKSLNLDSIGLHFSYLFLEEGNGGLPGYVFNSALQTAYLEQKNIDIISSHEAYHSITNSIFMDKFKKFFEGKPNDTLANHQNLLWYLEIVSEEGIADLIDKNILSATASPLSEEIKVLRRNEVFRCQQRIHQLDSLLADTSGSMNFLSLDKIIENGGHIPGRYMAEKIKEGNLLEEYIKHTGNPFQFFYFYNNAVENQVSAPKFSAKSIANLKELELKITKL